LINNGKGLVPNIIDNKKDVIIPIDHDLLVCIDLPSFYDKIDVVQDDMLKIYRNLYGILNRAHVKQTAMLEFKMKNYQQIVNMLRGMYKEKYKLLEILGKLTQTLEQAVNQENKLAQKIKVIRETTGHSTLSLDKERSFKLSKTENDLLKVREVKKKTCILIQEVKRKFNNFIINYDFVVSDTVRNLKNIEMDMNIFGIDIKNKL